MMEKFNLLGIGCLCFAISACQNNESVETDSAELKMQATVSSVNVSRTTSTADGHTDFVSGDKVGLFMPQEESSCCWTRDANGGWSSDKKQTWPNQKDKFDFCAYYPYSSSATRSSIPTPDLTSQTGKLNAIGDFDFLVAKKSCGFNDDNGNLAFTNDNAFQHVYSLVLVTLVKNASDATTSLKKATFEGTGAFNSQTYSFSDPEGLKSTGNGQADALSLTLNEDVSDDGIQIAVLVNPSESERAIDFAISYSREDINYKASTSAIKQTFKSGTCYKYKIRIEKEGLSLVGCSVVDWTIEDISEDIVIKDKPDTTE